MDYIYVFFAVFFVDVVWTLYIKWIQEDYAFRSGIAAMGIYVMGAYAILMYTESPIYLIPACLGAFLGTSLTILVRKVSKMLNDYEDLRKCGSEADLFEYRKKNGYKE